jgi:hypothetical protein
MATNPQRALLGGVPALSLSMAKLAVQWPASHLLPSLWPAELH